jgi:hypothetical protein
MNLLLPLIVLIILALLWAGSVENPKKRLCIIVSVLILILLLCWLQTGAQNMLEPFSLSGYAPLAYKLRVDNGNPMSMGPKSCDGYNYMDINNQISSTGTYDGIVLPNKLASAPLLNKVFINSPVGDDIQLTQDPASKNFPTVDGQPNSDKHLFMLANNIVSWDCCPSQFGTDSSRGCVCLSKEQLDLFRRRGANKQGMVEYPDM